MFLCPHWSLFNCSLPQQTYASPTHGISPDIRKAYISCEEYQKELVTLGGG